MGGVGRDRLVGLESDQQVSHANKKEALGPPGSGVSSSAVLALSGSEAC